MRAASARGSALTSAAPGWPRPRPRERRSRAGGNRQVHAAGQSAIPGQLGPAAPNLLILIAEGALIPFPARCAPLGSANVGHATDGPAPAADDTPGTTAGPGKVAVEVRVPVRRELAP